jgi:hypothetical protein
MGLGLVKKDNHVTKEELIQLFPRKKNTITEDTVSVVNATIDDPDFDGYSLVQTLVDYQGVMYNNSGKVIDYINAVKFCAFLETGNDSATQAYIKTFSRRDFVKERIGADYESVWYRELTSAASRYRSSPMVRDILTQADLPFSLLFRGHAYKAIEVLANLTVHAKADRDKINAAKFLLDAVKAPENLKIELGVGPNKEAVDLNTQLSAQLAENIAMQKKLIGAGVDLKEATKLNINLEDISDAEIE